MVSRDRVVSVDLRLLLLLSLLPFLLAWLLPNHYFPWAVAYQEFLSFAALLLLLVICFFSRLYVPRISQFFFLLALLPVVQYFSGLIYFSGDAWMASLYLSGFALAVAIGYSLSLDARIRVFLAICLSLIMVVGGVLSVWIALRQWLVLPGSIWIVDMPPNERPFANLAQPNNLATLLCMAMAGLFYLYEKNYVGRWGGGGLAVFLLFGMALTQSRTPWLGVVFALVLFFWKSRLGSFRLGLGGFSGLIVLYACYVFALPFISEYLSLFASGPLERAGALERWALWGQLWHAVWLEPWGYGWNQVSVAQVAVTLAFPVAMLTEHSHNIVLDFLLWNGPVLGIPLICLVIAWLFRLAWLTKSPEGFFALFTAGFVLVHAMLEFPLEYAFFLLPVGLLLGVACAEQRLTYDIPISRAFSGAVFLVGVSLFCFVWIEYREVEADHRLMRFENSRIGDLRAEQKAPDVVVLTQLQEFLRFARTPAVAGMTNDEIERMRKIAHRYPYVSSIYRYALALAVNGRVEAAREQLLVLRALHGDKAYAEAISSLRGSSSIYPWVVVLLQDLTSP